MNIVSVAAQHLTPMIVDKIASSLGITSPLAQKAIGAILPTILAGLLGSSSKSDGLADLTKALGQQDTDFLGKLGEMIGGSGQGAMIEAGGKTLGSLLGGSGVEAMCGAVAKFAGIGETPTKSLMGLVAPVVLGTIAKEQKTANLDAAGLGKLLSGQKEYVQAAMPAGLGDLLKGSGLLDSIAPPAAKPAAAAAVPRPAASQAAPAKPADIGGQQGQPTSVGWLPWVASLALLAFAGWYFLGGGQRVALPEPPRITLGTQDVGAQLGSVVEGLRGTLGGIRDEASARAAMPRLQDMSRQIDQINGLLGQLPPEGRRTLATYAASVLLVLRPMVEKALAGTAVAPVAKGVLDQIVARLDAMSKA